MAYPFNKVQHCVYKNTFLKDVRIAVGFSAIDPSSVRPEPLHEFFEQFTNAGIKVEDFLKNEFIRVFSNDQLIDFMFTLNYAEVKIASPRYTSFEEAKPIWNLLFGYLDALRIESVSKLIVRKYNALHFQTEGQNYDIKSVMGLVFCDELMAQMTDIDKDKTLNSIEKTWTKDDVESNSLLSIVYGIKKSDTAAKHDHLTLILSAESLQGPIQRSSIQDQVIYYNNVLFDAFHWCVKDGIIQNMKGQ